MAKMATTPVLLVQATPRIADALGRVLSEADFEVVASFQDHIAACSASGTLAEPELILLLEQASNSPQTDVIEYLCLSYPEAQVVVLGRADCPVALSAYVEAGASGRLTLAMTKSAMLRSLRIILYGGRLFVSGDGRKVVPENEWDRRQSMRRQTYMACRIDPGKGKPLVAGTIFEMSHAGAKIRMNAYAHLPSAFNIKIKEGLTRKCQVIRRSDGCFCVEFADTMGGKRLAAPTLA
jgi:DNA-binding NarL/FixJ family response regulator